MKYGQVLIVDDSSTSRMIIQRCVQMAGIEVARVPLRGERPGRLRRPQGQRGHRAGHHRYQHAQDGRQDLRDPDEAETPRWPARP